MKAEAQLEVVAYLRTLSELFSELDRHIPDYLPELREALREAANHIDTKEDIHFATSIVRTLEGGKGMRQLSDIIQEAETRGYNRGIEAREEQRKRRAARQKTKLKRLTATR